MTTTTDLRKRFSIWTDVLQEQEIVQSMQSGARLRKTPKNVVKQERDVEDYLHDVPSGKLRPGRADRRVRPGSKKATRKIKKNKKPDTGKKETPAPKSETTGTSKSKKRKLKKKARKLSPSLDIALKLKEPRIDLIQKVVETLGEEAAVRLLSETLAVESAGGLMTCNGSRRRTAGGVFFHLVKNEKNLTPEQSRLIFGEETYKRKRVTQKQKKSLDKLSLGLDSFTMGSDEPDADPDADAAAVSSAILQDVTSLTDNSDHK